MELWYKAVLIVTLTTNLKLFTRANFEDHDAFSLHGISRARRNTENLPGQNERIKINDNNKPTFKNCNNDFTAQLEENKNAGAYVTTVTAQDIDPPDQGGTISFKLILKDSERGKFKIDNETGVITSNVAFDRDEPLRQKEMYITVQVTDNGRPQLADVCSFKVTILDDNDNQPIFDKGNYVESVSVDTPERGEVMRISATDIDDGENARITYDLIPAQSRFTEFFQIDKLTGVITLQKSLEGQLNKKFNTSVRAIDNGQNPRYTLTEVEIHVVGSDKKYPSFINPPNKTYYLDENFSDHEETIVPLTAVSNIEGNAHVTFELVTGKTQQSNKDQSFVLVPFGDNEAKIILGRTLDYESINEYTLTVRITNDDSLAASININIKINDVNDNIPAFIEVNQGSVLENEPPGTPVMQIKAIDLDGTKANNIVSYRLASKDQEQLFSIDPNTGNITTKREFDRETNTSFNLRVIAEDNSPSVLFKNSRAPNSATQDFIVRIEDRNDNPPQFTKTKYVVDQILESTDVGKDVIEVKAKDKDTASRIFYSITEGNKDNAFEMESSTGKIRVKTPLDYEKIENYTLSVEAYDGKYSDKATVTINIQNVNDVIPVFDPFEKEIMIDEETLKPGCILNLVAHDPDIKDRNAPQNIKYRFVDEHTRDFLSVDINGCVMLTKALDRDPPNGLPKRQVIVAADDENGGPSSQTGIAEFYINLKDINDNPPYLQFKEIVWYENKLPDMIVKLNASDNDSEENGFPFTFKLGETADAEIREKFDVRDGNLYALVKFDREEKKFYLVPIDITDSPKDVSQNPLTGHDIMKVIIGDVNDNEMKSGSSEIFVYDYKGLSPDVDIGRVYVEDPDDWDLPDKTFEWYSDRSEYFELNNDNGTITKRQYTPAGKYELQFTVRERINFNEHQVKATVTVVVKEIPEEAVIKSGSMRLIGITPEEFVEKDDGGKSKKDILQSTLAKQLNTSLENVDVFTVFSSKKNATWTDIRFSAHGSPYYMPEKLNNEIATLQSELAKSIGGQIVMIHIDECLLESVCPSSSSCANELVISDHPAAVYTNKTSFVGVSAVVEPRCVCSLDVPETFVCHNGGTPIENSVCNCLPGYEGPNCQKLDVGFTGNGWALYPTIGACNDSTLVLHIAPNNDNGLVFYIGPQSVYPTPFVRDFMALELRDGYPVLLVDYGTGIAKIDKRFKKLTDGNRHRIDIRLQPESITMTVDGCTNTTCLAWADTPGANKLLNVNGPLQLGGVVSKNLLNNLAKHLHWEAVPTELGFHGCIHNLTVNDKTYNLGEPSLHKELSPTCDAFVAKAVTFGIDTNFLIAILICIAILIFLLLAVVVHRRKHDNLNEKDIDDIRENIINYEDEGGGEVDTGYDLDVLRRGDMDTYMAKPPIKDGVYGQCPEVPDISGFLDTKKDVCDKDPDNNPFDDVRHYAYEGDGNTSGSLSSLASCTDEGDLKFNYLSNFGPRFRKLADMYGEEPSDDDSHDGGEESWC